MNDVKKCSVCKEVLPLESYSKSARRKDGHRGECKECQKESELGRKSVSHASYRDRILAVIKKHGEPIDIHTLRANFEKSPAAQSGVSSALVNMRDRGEVRITGGGHSNSAKMVEIIPEFSVPNGRIVRLSDKTRWPSQPSRNFCGIASSLPSLILLCG